MAASGDKVYAALTNSSRLAIIRASDDVLEGTQAVGPGGVNGVAAVGDKIFTANRNAATLSVNQAGSGAFLQTIPVGNLPWGVAGVSDRVYVANFADNTVTTINPVVNSVIRTLSVSESPGLCRCLAKPGLRDAYQRPPQCHRPGWLTAGRPDTRC